MKPESKLHDGKPGHVLFILSAQGIVPQEILNTAEDLRQNGHRITYSGIGISTARFDPVSIFLAFLEILWSPTLRLLFKSRREGSFKRMVDLEKLRATPLWPEFLSSVDAVVVPGGHGKVYGDFIQDPRLANSLTEFYANGKIIGLLCHSVVAGVRARRPDGSPLIAGHELTCWPRALERIFAATPIFGKYFKPFGRYVEDMVKEVTPQVRTHPLPWKMPLAVVDGRLVTTWGPWTSRPYARALHQEIAKLPKKEGPNPLIPLPNWNRTEHGIKWQNWGRNFTCSPETIYRPGSIEDVVTIVQYAKSHGKYIRPVGSGYSYTNLVETQEVLVSMENFTGIEAMDETKAIARVRAGTTLHQLARELAKLGFALPTMGDIDRQTIAGAISTGTHGTGISCGSFSSLVKGITLVDGRASVREINESEPLLLDCVRLSLGTLGLITHVDLQVVPHYYLEVKRDGGDFMEMVSQHQEHVSSNRNFELFWFVGTKTAICKFMNVAPTKGPRQNSILKFYNEQVFENGVGWVASETIRFIPLVFEGLKLMAPLLVTRDRAILPAEAAYATPRWVKHHEIEYALPYENTSKAIAEIEAMTRTFPPNTVFPLEVRFTKGESAFLSPTQGKDTVWLAAHTYVKENYEAYFKRCEEIFLKYGGRPHWGKLHFLDGDRLKALYPRWDEFMEIRRNFDPDDVFLNPYLRRLLRFLHTFP